MLLGLIILCQLLLYGCVTYWSRWFEYASSTIDRPILLVLGALLLCFGLHLWALRVLLSKPSSQKVFVTVFCAALAFRGVLLPSLPIQEVDIYRYIWDGAVVQAGVSPFAYSPARVLNATESEDFSEDLGELVALRNRDEGLRQVLQRVHYAELTTIYPPVSQVVFAAAAKITPANSSLKFRVLLMKIVIVAFDVGVILVLAKLLSLLGVHQAWLIPYAWSPLILKEFANSGHLDSIAVLFAVLSVFLFIQARANNEGWNNSLFAGMCLGLGVGAKLFPIVLLPVLASADLGRGRWKPAGVLLTVGLLVSCVSLSQMIWDIRNPPADQVAANLNPPADLPPLPEETIENSANSPDGNLPGLEKSDDGLSTFLSRWEMNDLIFMFIEENMRANLNPVGEQEHWFVFLPQAWRSSFNSLVTQLTGLPPYRVPFVTTRAITLLMFGIIVLVLAFRLMRSSADERDVLQAVFLTLAWFWLLAPTQNPWYWSWALPFVAFARGRVWLAVGGVSLIYYLRFWLLYHYPEPGFANTDYSGTQFFDFVVVWLEFAPVLVMLLVLWCLRGSRRTVEQS